MNKYRDELTDIELKTVELIESKWNRSNFLRLETGYDDVSIRFVFHIPDGKKFKLPFYDKAIDLAYDVYEEEGDGDIQIMMGLG